MFSWPAAVMMSGAWPPPAPSVWKVWMARPLIAANVSSTKPLSFSVSVVDRDLDVHLVGDSQAIVDRRRRGAPVLVQLQPDRAGADLFAQRLWQRARCPCRAGRH